MKKIAFILLLIALVLGGCSKDDKKKESTPVDPGPSVLDPVLTVSHENISLTGNQWRDRLFVNNTGEGVLLWNLGEIPNWLTVSKTSGQITDRQQDTLWLSIDLSKISGNSINVDLNFTSNGGNSIVNAEYKAPVMQVWPTVLDFDRHTVDKEMQISNEGGGMINWEIIGWPEWINIGNDTTGTIYNRPFDTVIAADLSKLDYGEHEGRFTVKSNAGTSVVVARVLYVREIEVYPGEGAASVELLQSYSIVKRNHGNPSNQTYREAIEDSLYEFKVYYPDKGLTFYFITPTFGIADNSDVKLIEMNPPYDGLTEEMIGIGSTKDELVAAYGEPQSIEGNVYLYSSMGINFTIKNNKVEAMLVYLIE